MFHLSLSWAFCCGCKVPRVSRIIFDILFNYISGTKQQSIETSPTLEPMPSPGDQHKCSLEDSLNTVLPTAYGLPCSHKSKLGCNDDLMVSSRDTLSRKCLWFLVIILKNLQSTTKSLIFTSVNPHNNHWGKCYYYVHFTGKEMRLCPKSHSH